MKTLDEIRAENKAAEEAEAKTTPPVKTQEDLEEDDSDADDVAVAPKAPETAKAPDGDKEKPKTDQVPEEDWLKEDDAKGSGMQVPASVLAATRTKLKGQLKEKDSELETLRAELNQIKQAVSKPTIADIPPAPLKPPVMQEYETVEEYQAALSRYTASEVQRQLNLVTQTQNAKARTEAVIDATKKSVDTHYERAAELVKTHAIAPEVYQQADMRVRQAIESVLPKSGDAVTDSLIARLGVGSEKVMYFLGRSESARAILTAKLIEDPTGIAASMYLGELKAQKAGNPANVSSMAPAPAPRPRGQSGGGGNTDADGLKKQYDAAHKKGDTQAAFNLKRQAKQAGISTGSW